MDLIDYQISKAINCKDCSNCCRNISIFVLKSELLKMEELKVPLSKKNGFHFISLKTDGTCYNLNKNNRCNIYDYRPMTCRLFPFYLMKRISTGFENKWIKYQFCPTKNRILKEINGKPNMDELRMIILEIEKLFTSSEIEEMLSCDFAISNIDRLEVGATDYIEIMNTYKLPIKKLFFQIKL